MKISVVIPVYNVADYLPACMDSVLANSCTDCEVILVDDGSTDGVSPGLCDDYARREPELVRVIHQLNGGPGSARNTGLAAARGEYVLFVDSDDTVAPDALAVLRRSMEKTVADVYTFQMACHEPGGPRCVTQIAPPTDGAVTLKEKPELLLSQPAIWARLWRRELFTKNAIRFPERSWVGEDLRTVTKLLTVAETIVVLPEVLYFYLLRPGSLMRSENAERNRDMIRTFEDVLQWLEQRGLRRPYEQELCALAVEHLYLAASVRVARADPGAPLLEDMRRFMEDTFPDYGKNPYVRRMSRSRKIALRLVEHRQWKLLRLLFSWKEKAGSIKK